MKKITVLFVMLLMSVLATNKAFAQDDNDDFLKTFNGSWDFQKVEVDKSNKANAAQTAKVKTELETKYKGADIRFVVDKKRFVATVVIDKKNKAISGTFSMEGDDIILTKQEDNSIFLRGKLYDFNESKNMGISYTEKGAKVNLIFTKF